MIHLFLIQSTLSSMAKQHRSLHQILTHTAPLMHPPDLLEVGGTVVQLHSIRVEALE